MFNSVNMKKLLLFITLAAAMAVASAQPAITGGRVTIGSDQDVQMIVKQPQSTQQVFNTIDIAGMHLVFDRFQVSCLATKQELQGLPSGARITGIALDGKNMGGDTSFNVSVYLQNSTLTRQNVDASGISQHPFPGDEYLVASDADCTLPTDTSRSNMFDLDINPFVYDGNSLLVTLGIAFPENEVLNFALETTLSNTDNALVIRTQDYCINSMFALLPIFMPNADFTFDAKQLPAFRLRYITNDIRGRVLDAQGNTVSGLTLAITDETDNTSHNLGIQADGTFNFVNADPSHLYTVAIAGGDYDFKAEHLAFADDNADIVLDVTLGAEGFEGDINADGAVNGEDLNILINIVLGKDNASNYTGNADLVDDDRIDGSDLNKLINILLGK